MMDLTVSIPDNVWTRLIANKTEDEIKLIIISNLKTIAFEAEIKAYLQVKQEEFRLESDQQNQELQASKSLDIKSYIDNL